MSAPEQARAGDTLMIVGQGTTQHDPGGGPILIGRSDDVDVRIRDDGVSRRHAQVLWRDGWVLEDLRSSNGTWHEGRRVQRLPLTGETTVLLGDPRTGPRLTFVTAAATDRTSLPSDDLVHTIGRDPRAWLHLDDPIVSWRHAELQRVRGTWVLEDLGSTNQTILNGRPVERHALTAGDRVLIGNTTLYFDGDSLGPVDGAGFVVDSASLALRDGRRIVDQVSFEIAKPSLVAVIGPSGAGKSSLLRLVTGQVGPSSGSVSLDSATMQSQRRAHRGRIGVVPQHTVAHPSLTARRALDYTARLRLAFDVGGAERRRLIEDLAAQLGLGPHLDTPIARMSGGQQRRVGIAMELLTDPSMLILDEPTAGLDPSLVLQIMTLLRQLADGGKRVLVVTHDLEHLALVDRVLVLRAGGTVAFYGPPGEVFAHFGTSTWAETFALLAQPAVGPRPSSQEPGSTLNAPFDLPRAGGGLRTFAASGLVVLARQLRLIRIDRLYVVLLLAMPVALGVLALAVPGSDGLGRTGDQTSAEAARLLVLVVVGAAFLGLSASVRDLVGERTIFEHEREAGLSPGGYLTAKVLVFSLVAALQAALLVYFLLSVRDGPDRATTTGSPTLEIAVAAVGTALTGVALGLAVSARVGTTEQSMPPLVLFVMAQLVLCGGLFPIDGRGVMGVVSWLSPTRWGYAAAASTVDLNNVSAAIDDDALWVHTTANWVGCLLPLVALGAVFLAVAARGVSRRPVFG